MLAIQLARQERCTGEILLKVDNQAVIQALRAPKAKLGSYILEEILKLGSSLIV